MSKQVLYLMLVATALLNTTANILIKMGASKAVPVSGDVVRTVWNVIWSPITIAGLVAFGLAFVAYSVVLSGMQLSIAYPIITGAGFMIVLIVSSFLFGERVTSMKLIGIGLILTGIWVASM